MLRLSSVALEEQGSHVAAKANVSTASQHIRPDWNLFSKRDLPGNSSYSLPHPQREAAAEAEYAEWRFPGWQHNLSTFSKSCQEWIAKSTLVIICMMAGGIGTLDAQPTRCCPHSRHHQRSSSSDDREPEAKSPPKRPRDEAFSAYIRNHIRSFAQRLNTGEQVYSHSEEPTAQGHTYKGLPFIVVTVFRWLVGVGQIYLIYKRWMARKTQVQEAVPSPQSEIVQVQWATPKFHQTVVDVLRSRGQFEFVDGALDLVAYYPYPALVATNGEVSPVLVQTFPQGEQAVYIATENRSAEEFADLLFSAAQSFPPALLEESVAPQDAMTTSEFRVDYVGTLPRREYYYYK